MPVQTILHPIRRRLTLMLGAVTVAAAAIATLPVAPTAVAAEEPADRCRAGVRRRGAVARRGRCPPETGGGRRPCGANRATGGVRHRRARRPHRRPRRRREARRPVRRLDRRHDRAARAVLGRHSSGHPRPLRSGQGRHLDGARGSRGDRGGGRPRNARRLRRGGAGDPGRRRPGANRRERRRSQLGRRVRNHPHRYDGGSADRTGRLQPQRVHVVAD